MTVLEEVRGNFDRVGDMNRQREWDRQRDGNGGARRFLDISLEYTKEQLACAAAPTLRLFSYFTADHRSLRVGSRIFYGFVSWSG